MKKYVVGAIVISALSAFALVSTSLLAEHDRTTFNMGTCSESCYGIGFEYDESITNECWCVHNEVRMRSGSFTWKFKDNETVPNWAELEDADGN